jgi:drug/metabolite transporter (DMT)-like permease
VPLAAGLALVAALVFAGSASLQQHAARRYRPTGPGPDRPPRRTAVFAALWRLLRRLVREPLWLVGWATNLVGFGIQAVALLAGSVALVQPLLTAQLLFAVPLAGFWLRRLPTRLDILAAGSVAAGLAIFLSVRGVAPAADRADRARLILAVLAAAGAVAAILLGGFGLPLRVRATFIAVAAGICFAVSATMIKLTADDLAHRGVPATARDWPGYALAASTFAGLVLEQGAFAAGALPSALAAMSITNPMVSYLLGVFAYGVRPPHGPGALAGLASAGLLVCLGAIGLARSPLVLADVRGAEPTPGRGRGPGSPPPVAAGMGQGGGRRGDHEWQGGRAGAEGTCAGEPAWRRKSC